ncbi:TIR-NBS-LRR resistance protein [Trifolium medium]|uniref:TIR-NBS-LRR resistance protein n=1 Tax=Trifolium medium TaxID=97028 RepID=A0A392M2P3_9FABA|nr:TIR-NBS-LRR resistance protein [Trifolium medium]
MSTNAPQINYDVFVSFRGDDIRRNFLGHLVDAFHREQINAFVDYKINKGDEILHALDEAIEGSSISLIIFSKNYASSRWCLDELVKIIECKESYGQIIIPVFYEVDPRDVRHQEKSYQTSFAELEEKNYNLSTLEKWRRALNKSAAVAGIELSKYRDDAKLLKEIINVVLKNMSKHPVNSQVLVGIDRPIAHLKSLLKKESEKVRVIGIWGEDVKINTPKSLSDDIVRRVGQMKVLIVLDDVKNTNQLEMLFGTLDWFRPDSRIILTSRDKQVLIANEVDDEDIYEAGVLSSDEALELFNLKAFRQNNQLKMEEYYELSNSFVDYAGGIPLVLEILGCLLRGKEKEFWESQLDKLKREPIKEVYDVMRLSYDDLDRLEQNIFLDIACFFNGLNLKVDYMKLLLKDRENDNSVAVGLFAKNLGKTQEAAVDYGILMTFVMY